MPLLVQLTVSGLALGGIYALVAVGFSLTFAASRTVNFSQGQAVMIGAVLYYFGNVSLGMPAVPTFLAVIVIGALLGLVVAFGAVLPAIRGPARTEHGWLLSTIAVGIAMENVALATFGSESRALPSMFGRDSITVFGAGVVPHELILIGVAIGLAVAIDMFLSRALPGVVFRAVAANLQGASLVGIDTRRMVATSYALSTALAAAAGILIAPLVNVAATMGTIIGLKAFAIAAVAGMRRPIAIFLVALFFGLIESFVAGYIGFGARDLIAFGGLVLILGLRPAGFSEGWRRQV